MPETVGALADHPVLMLLVVLFAISLVWALAARGTTRGARIRRDEDEPPEP